MLLPYDKRLRERSRKLRENMTSAEEFLWAKIRTDKIRGYRFYRQKPIGIYIADFYCHKAKLVVEIDGGQHTLIKNREYDQARSEFFNSLGIRVVRFSNRDILSNVNEVLENIKQCLV
jgi:very-short-patch-repair endonuclease